MISLVTLCTALALSQAGYVNASPAPVPTSGPITKRDMRPRYLRDAGSLPERGIFDDGVITLPIRRGPAAQKKAKRQNLVQVPIADNQDISYGVALDIGGQAVTFQVDTGSADLWSMTKDCTTPSGDACAGSSSIPAYTPSKTFKNLGIPLQINYGSSEQPTFASGTIGLDNVTFGGMTQSQQAFASMNSTNNQITDSYSGIFGVGFPYISEIVSTVVDTVLSQTTQQLTGATLLETYFQAMQESSPLLISLASAGKLKAPMYTLSLQREDPTSADSNAGVMTIGGLPSGISNDSLTWVPVQPYSIDISLFGGLQTPIDATVIAEALKIMPTSPMVWEAPIDGVYVNGQLLKDSTAKSGRRATNPGLTALFDSGTTQTLLTASDLQSPLFPSVNADDGSLPCNTVINMAIGIAGKQFPINPFDLIEPFDENDSEKCVPGISQADPPSEIRNTLIAFYWGNLTDQASDPARMGFLSTTSASAADAEFSSFWKSAGTTFAFPTAAPQPKVTTTNIANPISAGAGGSGSSGSGSGSGSGGGSSSSGAMGLSIAGWATAAIAGLGFASLLL
ncbi:hypothetical protein HWV62_36697 [Athelia sp. TMB]|nr:hypothetical protein HWV62_36697 [Athelia sp. TMB]